MADDETDLDAEYSVRGRVPEHAEINARWAREAAEYRTMLDRAGRAEIGLVYGPGPRQRMDIFSPAKGDAAPLSLFVHGGYWRGQDPGKFSHVARGLNAQGVRVALVGYDLCPSVRVPDIVDQVRQACLWLWQRHRRRITLYGHSAGGHLAACMLATDWRRLDDRAPVDLVGAAYAISGVFDLTPLVATRINADLRLHPDAARAVSPRFWPAPRGLPLDAVVGGAESGAFRRQSRDMAETWGRQGAQTRFEEVPGANHFTILDPLTDPDSAMTRRLLDLAALTEGASGTGRAAPAAVRHRPGGQRTKP